MRASLIFGFLFVVACGGSVTSVDGNQNTANLTPTDQNQLCFDTYQYVRSNFSTDDIAKMECGFKQAETPQTCASDYAACLTTARANINQLNLPAVPDCTGFDTQIAACNTTVAEYTKCLQQEVDAMKTLEGAFPLCSDNDATVAELAALSKLSSDCVTLMKTCQITFAPGK